MLSGRIMLQGTGTHVGKTVLATAMCYIFSRQGLKVAPFKPWNLTSKSYTLPDGRKIGLSLALQARAAGIEPCVEMNPFLVSPRDDGVTVTHVLGEERRSLRTWVEDGERPRERDLEYLSRVILDSASLEIKRCYDRLASRYDLIVIEGAGSPVELDVGDPDLPNMRAAAITGSPILLVADIDVGEAFASLIETAELPYHLLTLKASPGFASVIGTLELLGKAERERVRGIVLNRYRGSRDSLRPVVEFIEERTGIPVLGVIPYVSLDLPEEDISEREEEPGIEEATPELEKLGEVVAQNLSLERVKELAFGDRGE